MIDNFNWHDAHALMLIDRALEQGRLTDDLVAQIREAFAKAETAERHTADEKSVTGR
jgi:hypothetical protein